MAVITQIKRECWNAAQYCGGECARLLICKCSDKKTCKAHKTTIVKMKKRIMADGREVLDENSLLLS